MIIQTEQLDRIESTQREILRQLKLISSRIGTIEILGEIQVSTSDDVFAAITRLSTAVDGMTTYVQGLVSANVITQEQANKIIAQINTDSDKLETAMTANVAPPTV